MTTAIELKDPVASDPVPDLVENILGASQYISPTYWINEAMKIVCDTDPMAWIAAQFAGDWEAVQRAGIALAELSRFNEDHARILDQDVSGLSVFWRGEAAEAAADYFTDYASAVRGQSHDLAHIGEQIQQVAIGMYETANAVKSLWSELFDMLIVLGVTLAATAFTAPTGVGGLVGGSLAVAEIAAAATLWKKIVEVTGYAWTGAQAAIGVITGMLAGIENSPIRELPLVSYNHPEA